MVLLMALNIAIFNKIQFVNFFMENSLNIFHSWSITVIVCSHCASFGAHQKEFMSSKMLEKEMRVTFSFLYWGKKMMVISIFSVL